MRTWAVVVLVVVMILVFRGEAEDKARSHHNAHHHPKKPQVIHPNTPEFEEMVRKIKSGHFTQRGQKAGDSRDDTTRADADEVGA